MQLFSSLYKINVDVPTSQCTTPLAGILTCVYCVQSKMTTNYAPTMRRQDSFFIFINRQERFITNLIYCFALISFLIASLEPVVGRNITPLCLLQIRPSWKRLKFHYRKPRPKLFFLTLTNIFLAFGSSATQWAAVRIHSLVMIDPPQ